MIHSEYDNTTIRQLQVASTPQVFQSLPLLPLYNSLLPPSLLFISDTPFPHHHHVAFHYYQDSQCDIRTAPRLVSYTPTPHPPTFQSYTNTLPGSLTTSLSRVSRARPLKLSTPPTRSPSPPSTRLPRRMWTSPSRLPVPPSRVPGSR